MAPGDPHIPPTIRRDDYHASGRWYDSGPPRRGSACDWGRQQCGLARPGGRVARSASEGPPCGVERQQAICGACIMATRALQRVPAERRCGHSGALRTGVDVASSWLLPLPRRYRQRCLLDLLADFSRFHDGRDLQLGFCYTGVSVPASVRCMPIRECGGQLGWLRIPPADLDVGAFPCGSTHSWCLAGTDFFN